MNFTLSLSSSSSLGYCTCIRNDWWRWRLDRIKSIVVNGWWCIVALLEDFLYGDVVCAQHSTPLNSTQLHPHGEYGMRILVVLSSNSVGEVNDDKITQHTDFQLRTKMRWCIVWWFCSDKIIVKTPPQRIDLISGRIIGVVAPLIMYPSFPSSTASSDSYSFQFFCTYTCFFGNWKRW